MSIKVCLKNKLGHFSLDINLESNSRRIGILGASGCGKSMTLKSIAGVEPIDAGSIVVDGKVFFDSAAKINIKPQQRKIGYLFQNYALFPTMTVEQNIMAGLHGKKEEKKKRAEEMIAKFQLAGLEDHLPGQLSGGQQQRTALARIMAYQPDMILLDEPFSALDSYLSDKLQQEMLEMLADYEGTVILVSHNRDEIYRFSEELLIMEAGQLITKGKTREVFANPGTKAAARLTGCKNIADIQYLDDTRFEIPDWNCCVKLKDDAASIADEQQIAARKQATAVGYRAHEFVPVWGERQENCIPFRLKSMAQLPFERKYFIEGANGTEVCWFVQKDRWGLLDESGDPDFLQIRTDQLIFLREE